MAGPVAAMITGFGKVKHRTDELEPAGQHAQRRLRIARPEHREVEAAAEHPLVAGEHDGLGFVLLGPVQRLVDGGLHVGPQYVDFAVVERDGGDGLVELVVHGHA